MPIYIYIEALAILLDTTVRKSAVDREDLKPYWKSKKYNHIYVCIYIYIYVYI